MTGDDAGTPGADPARSRDGAGRPDGGRAPTADGEAAATAATASGGRSGAGHVELDGVTKEYPGGVTAVSELSLRLRRGELLVLVGPSGCGKSTTLRCLAGLEAPTAGDVRVDGRSVLGEEPEARDVAMVFQNYALYPHKTARANIGFGLRMTTDLSRSEVDERVEAVAETLGVTELLDKRPRSLSGGQQQRVALGRAIVRDPELFLLDEPLSNLDATLRSRMRTEIRELQQELGVTTAYVTHDQTEAMTMGDRIAVLDGGELQQVGTPMECYHEPANRFVAGFIGEPSMNVLDCRFDAGRGLFEGPIRYAATDGLAAAAREATSDAVAVGVRPAGLSVVGADDDRRDDPAVRPDGDGGSGGSGGAGERAARTVEGLVNVVEPVGEESFVYVTLADGTALTVETVGATRELEGTAVRVRLPPDRVHLFDGRTGAALRHPPRAADRSDVTGTPPSDDDGDRGSG
jgi:multiple sugar transport system ATP-binding protein